MSETARFQPYLSRWNLVPDGAPIRTHSSDLLPVSADGREAMLKVARVAEEKTGARLMAWWAGEGAARVMQHDEDAILIERASGTRSLSALAREGQDDEATLALCGAVARLHQPRPAPPSGLGRLEDWFAPLVDRSHYAILARCAATARLLLAEPTEILPLHGDVHHGNVLDFRDRGWLAIDPKGLIGERSFDYANLFRNPDLATATTPDRLARRVQLVADSALLDRVRLLRWIAAWAGLSALWSLDDAEEEEAGATLAIAELAMAILGEERH